MTVLINSIGPIISGWHEVEMTDQQLAEWLETACISEIEANRHLFSEEEFELLNNE